ncbi:helix-turn-helix domain-containing protein [Haloimpatiens sp. FM7315]|uniref:helix-turn-helix domain-containing protein n=1 Tax=Haloimpatiens sp. FM7315 TaxID=3298609 RepID=UPI0035A2A5A5
MKMEGDKVPINTIIQEKRKEMGLTQEQVAEYLGVSTPAVNKWEKGVTYPDITLLSPLARLLNVDLNTLLCFNEGLTEKEIFNFIEKVSNAIEKDNFESGFNMVMEKIKEYPSCFKLIYWSALTLDGILMMERMDPHKKESYSIKITELYNRVANCDEENIRNPAAFMMAYKYIGNEKYDKAQKLLDSLKEKPDIDKRQLQANLWIKQEKFKEARELLEGKMLLSSINEVQCILISLTEIALKEGNMEEASNIAEISSKGAKLFDLWDYSSYVAPLEVALYKKDVKNSIYLLKSIFKASFIAWEIKKSVLYKHIEIKTNLKDYGRKILPGLIFEIENNSKYEFLYSDVEFQEFMKEYKAKLNM